MMPRLPVFVFVLALALVVAALAAACGGDGELTLEEYFQEFMAIRDDAREQMKALGDPSQEDFDSEEEEIEAWRNSFNAGAANLRHFANGLNDIDPPTEIENLHNEAVNVLKDGAQLSEQIVDQLAGVESISEFEEVFELADPEFTALNERGTEVCLDLQDIADEKGVDVDLGCEE